MALTRFALKLLAPHIQRGARVLCMGYPDILVTPQEASGIVGREVQKVSEWGVSHKSFRGVDVVDTHALFLAMEVSTVVYVDVCPSRGREMKLDLNVPQPGLSDFDLVIDGGTIEHCANIGQALKTAAEAVCPGGHVFHSPPLSMVNHGFYNICPTLLVDFYAQNGWDILHLSAFDKNTLERFDIEKTARFRAPVEAALYFLAKRNAVMANKEIKWPNQTRYGG